MRYKMRFLWIFILMLMAAGVKVTDGTLESWGFSQLLSLLGHADHELESEAIQPGSLSRHKRAVSSASEYVLDVEISIPDPSLAIQIKQYLTNQLTLPLALGTGDTNVTSIKVTTSCNQTGSQVQCSCESGYTWSSDVCALYTPCQNNNNCSCITSSTFPTQFCQPLKVSKKMSLNILEAFTNDLYNPSSSKYIKYKSDLENQFNISYQSLLGFQSATVTGFRPGSVIADYTVVSEPTTAAALTTANNNLLTNLANTPYNVSSIQSIVTGWSSISVSPSNIFLNDTAQLTCTVNVTAYSDVSWYFNGTTKIANNSNWSFSTSSVAGTIQSILIIKPSLLSNSGTYQCNIVLDSSTYTADTALQVNTMDLTAVSSSITCNNQKVTAIQCCTTGGTATFNLTCQKTNGGIVGISESSQLCKSYTIMGDSQSCSSAKFSSFSCVCATQNGAYLSKDINVTYTNSSGLGQVYVTASKNDISEWTELRLTCMCNIPNVTSMTWHFIDKNDISNIITSNVITSIQSCNSILTVPSVNLSVNWNGTFKCKVQDVSSANRTFNQTTINVYRMAKRSDITRSPISSGFQCNSDIIFTCSVDSINSYHDQTILEIYNNFGIRIYNGAMTRSATTFTASYTPVKDTCGDLVAFCNISNLLGDTVRSDNMILTYISDPKCTGALPETNINIGVGEANKNYTVSCQTTNPYLDGTLTYLCNNSNSQWQKIADNCVSKALNSLKGEADKLLASPNPDQVAPSVISQLSSTVSQNQNITNSANNIRLVVNILQQVGTSAVKNVQENVMKDFINTVSIVVNESTIGTWNDVPDKTSQSSNLLQSVESFAGKLVISGSPVNISTTNIQLQGNVVENLTSGYNADFNFNQASNLKGNVSINKIILDAFLKDTKVVSVAYSTLKDIIGVPQNSTSDKVLNGLIMTTILSRNSDTFSTLSNVSNFFNSPTFPNFSINMDFKISNSSLTNASCVWWNFTTTKWDTTGCQALKRPDETVYCACDHLTSFSILMSTSDIPDEVEQILSYITYIGVGISMLSLVVCIIIEAMVWKSVTKNKTSYMRHLCIINIAVTLLMADIWFIIGAALDRTNDVKACIAATFFAHLFYLCVFFWMLTMGLILFYRLMCVFHDLSKTTMMGISFFLGYGCPIIISVITVAATQSRTPSTYLNEKKCWLSITDSKAFLAFVIPAFAILLVNFVTLLVVIIKVLRPSIGDKPKKEEKSSLNHITKCILILTPLLGLTWGFGIGTLLSKSIVILGIFAALNSLQGLFILLFGCLMDKKVRDALFSRFSLSRWSSQQTKTSNVSSTEPTFAKKGINLFGKKGAYNISSAQVSSSDMASSNSYSLLN